tara:strand:+ start:401 stop:1909 length:1509 start_codon:yes stop_codon:yes gene_type:complete
MQNPKTILIVIILLFFIGCRKNISNEITITGKITGATPEKLEYTVPKEGVFIYGFKEYGFKKNVKLDSLGQYQIKIPIEKIAFVCLMAPKKSPVTLIVEPGNAYVVNFDFTQEASSKTYKILGSTKKIQELYNKLPLPEHIQVAARPFFKDSVASQIQSKIADLKGQELSPFKDLLAKDSISKSMYDFIELDRSYYYSAVQGTVGFIKFIMNEREPGVFTEDLKNMWTNTFNNDLLSRADFQKTNWGYALAENYLFYKDYNEFSFDIDKIRNSNDDIFFLRRTLNNAEKHLSPYALEYYKAVYLYMELLQKDYQKEFITIFDEFKKDYPTSTYSEYLAPMVATVVDFHKKTEQPYDASIKFVENYDKITNFTDLLSQFKGKKIYIDIWGTWCSPCKKEFEHKDDLKKLLNSKDVEVLYICEGRNSKEDVWKNMIKFYDLEGHHLITNEELLADIIKIFGNNSSFYYPRYILIDENGKTIQSVAAKPSQLEKLKEQLTQFESI